MKIQKTYLLLINTLLLGIVLSSTSMAAPNVAISGYSPVSYFTVGKPEKGNAEFAVEHKGKVYYLTSEEQVALFNQDPEKYRPRHDVCAYSLTLGKIRPLDPTNFKIVADTLLMFHKSDTEDGRLGWEQSEIDEEELLRRADHQFKLLF